MQNETNEMMNQHLRIEALISLLSVSRKLGELEGIISMVNEPENTLVKVQEDLKRVYENLSKYAGINKESDAGKPTIGGDSS